MVNMTWYHHNGTAIKKRHQIVRRLRAEDGFGKISLAAHDSHGQQKGGLSFAQRRISCIADLTNTQMLTNGNTLRSVKAHVPSERGKQKKRKIQVQH